MAVVTVSSLGVLAVATVTVMAAPMLDTTLQSVPAQQVAPVAVPAQEKQARPPMIKNPAIFNEAGPAIRGQQHDPEHKNGGCKSKQKKTDKL